MCVSVLGSDLGHHIRLFQDLNFVVQVGQCLISCLAPHLAGKPSKRYLETMSSYMYIAQLLRVMLSNVSNCKFHFDFFYTNVVPLMKMVYINLLIE